MLQWVFAIYMGLVMVVGPRLCCCSLMRLCAGPVCKQAACEQPPCEQPPSEQPPSPVVHSCCHCEPCGEEHNERQAQGGCPHDKTGDPLEPGCPCRDSTPKPALVDRQVETPDQSQAESSALSIPSLGGFPGACPGVDGVPAMAACARPFLTAGDLIRAHHMLRC